MRDPLPKSSVATQGREKIPTVLSGVLGTVLETEPAHLIALYKTMVKARAIDRWLWVLHRRGMVGAIPSGIGHEAVQVAAGSLLRPGSDWALPHDRSLALCLAMGASAFDYVLAVLGKANDLSSAGRQAPGPISSRRLRLVTTSRLPARQVVHAAGIAYATRLQRLDEVVLTTVRAEEIGEGDWHEGLNFAAVHGLPLIAIVEDNDTAWNHGPQMGVETLARSAEGYGIAADTVDGGDLGGCLAVVGRAIDRARRGEGPTLVHARVVRLTSVATREGQPAYHAQQELEGIVRRDPVERLRRRLLDSAILDPDGAAQLERDAAAEVEEALMQAKAAPDPEPYAASRHVVEGA